MKSSITKEMEDALVVAHLKTSAFYARHGFVDVGDEPKIAFARIVEIESGMGNQVDFPMARKMFVLGYLKGATKK